MEVSTERGSPCGQVSAAGVRGLFAAGVVLLGSAVADVSLVVYVAGRSSTFQPTFAGWQVDAVEAAGAAILVLLTVASILAFLRRRRATRISRRGLAILLAVVPGLAIGGCLSAGLGATITWAGSHTAEAAAARAAQAAYRISPQPMPVSGPPADVALTARMLTPSDLGAGWYQGIQPATEGIPVTPEGSSEGRVSQAQTVLNEQHWNGSGWVLDRLEIERITKFDTTARAAASVAAWRQAHAGSTLTTFGKVTVAIASTNARALAAFIVGADVIILDVDTRTAQPEDRDAIISAAVAAASPAR